MTNKLMLKNMIWLILICLISFSSAQITIDGHTSTNVNNLVDIELPSVNTNNATLNVNNSVCWGGNCNTTSYVLKTGDTMSGALNFDLSLFTNWLIFKISGVPVLSFNSNFGVVALQSLNNQDLYIGNDDIAQRMVFGDDGAIAYVALRAIEFYNGINLKLNMTSSTSEFRHAINTSSDAYANNFKVQGGNINCQIKGCNITNIDYMNSNHTSIKNLTVPITGNVSFPFFIRQLTPTFAFNTKYENNRSRDIHIYGSISATVTAVGDISSGIVKVNNTGRDMSSTQTNVQSLGISSWNPAVDSEYHGNYPFSFIVPSGSNWTINTTIGGSGSINIDSIWMVDE